MSETAIGWERALMAAEKVKERLRRATRALDQAGVAYAVVGGNAVAEWVGRVDEDAVRNTRDVDLLIQRSDFTAVQTALEAAGFVYYHFLDVDMFLDGPQGKPSAAVHLLYAGEKVRPEYEHATPDLSESEPAGEFQVAALPALVKNKIVGVARQGSHPSSRSHRRWIDRCHLARSLARAAVRALATVAG